MSDLILITKKFNFTKETATTCPRYKDSNVYGCIFSPTAEQFARESKAGIWCAKCFESNMKL